MGVRSRALDSRGTISCNGGQGNRGSNYRDGYVGGCGGSIKIASRCSENVGTIACDGGLGGCKDNIGNSKNADYGEYDFDQYL